MNTEPFTNEERQRYARHFILPEVGIEGQTKIRNAKVLIVGLGGLGSPAALYLAAAGIGTLGFIDKDGVELSNLQRQIIHTTRDIGKFKVQSATDKIHLLNPHVEVKTYAAYITTKNALEIIAGYDIVVDGTDNYPTRYLLNDACVFLKKTMVYGSIFRFEGQVAVFENGENTPCYRCIYPQPPPPSLVQNCAEAGVLGVLPGIIGTLQATEVLKCILKTGKTLAGKILCVDTLQMRFETMNIARDVNCVVCGDNPNQTQLINYEQFCNPALSQKNMIEEITVFALQKKIAQKEEFILLDVRQPEEYAIANLKGVLIPLHELSRRYAELEKSKEIIIHCHHGIRSANAVQFLQQVGFTNVKNLAGGIDAWSQHIDSSVPLY
jgi:adenylyltransferase/sulfurtransferase